MKMKYWLCGALALVIALAINGCKKHDDQNMDSRKVSGYLYTTLNGEDENKIVSFTRHADGSLSDEKSYSTKSKGGANIAAGGDAHGDFDAQGAIQIIGNYLLNVNAGGNQLSVFSLNRKNGELAFVGNTSSGGTRPVSIGYTKKSGSNDEYWLVVGNQWNNPNVQKDGAAIERYPDNAFHMQNLKAADASDAERNIQLFTFNAANGKLTSEKQLDKYVRENGGPTTVSFSDDGSKLAVSTWGIAHFDTKLTSLEEQHASRVYVYDFSNGSISGKRYFEEEGIAGTIGFSWSKSSNSTLFVSNFNLIPSKLDNSVTVLKDNGTTVIKTAKLGATADAAINESCWTTLNPSGTKLYVASFQTNFVSSFHINSSGLAFADAEHRRGNAPNGDSKDVWVTPDDQFIYNLGAYQSFSINRFDISGNSIAYKTQTQVQAAASGAGIAGKYNFLGLMGFDIEKGY